MLPIHDEQFCILRDANNHLSSEGGTPLLLASVDMVVASAKGLSMGCLSMMSNFFWILNA